MASTGSVRAGSVSASKAGAEVCARSSSARLGVKSTASVSTAPASVSRAGTAGTAHWRGVARAVGDTAPVDTRARAGPAPVTTAGGETPARGGRRRTARTR